MGKGVIVGNVSVAEYWYQDIILPASGLHQGSEWDIGEFPVSKMLGVGWKYNTQRVTLETDITPDTETWRKSDATVLPNLVAIRAWLYS
ncbi:hypothetical protein Pfo_029153 [Paulownia fortunei]|nr:hypothetical protein Pfo_029153 [Paulownia fortunei]